MVRNLLIAMLLLACSACAQTDLRPNGDVAHGGWTVTGSGTGDCDITSSYYGCINSDVESPEDSTNIYAISPTADGNLAEFDIEDAPGDCGSVNSITFKVRAAANGVEDELRAWLEVSGTQTGATQTMYAWGTPTCTISTSMVTDCSFTDSNWDALSCSDVTNLTVNLDVATNNNGMPDDTTFQVYEVELVLDYNVAGAAPTIKKRMIIFGLGPQPARKEDARIG